MKIVATLILVVALAACSTVAGVGKDIQSSAEWTKEKMGSK
jgi:predicted small secreted protein